jgi:predicted esterase
MNWLAIAIAVGLIVTGAFAEISARNRDVALAMPISNMPGTSGRFVEIWSDRFSVTPTSEYKFEPSEMARKLSEKHVSFDGFRPRGWYEFVPKSQEEMPLVILLHGAGRDGLSQIDMWKDVANRYGIALLAPNSAGRTWSLADASPQFIEKLVSTMASEHNIDMNRVFLYGHSAGATYALFLLNRTQGPWRAAALHAGYAPLKYLSPPETAKPFRQYMGVHEQIFSLDEARHIGKSLAQYGHENDLVVIPKHDHWFYSIGPQIAEDAWKWFETNH